MSMFQEYSFEWNGRKHTIPADRIMGAIGAVEEHLTLHEIHAMMNTRGTVRMERISRAYGALLRYAGVEVTDEDVYASFFAAGATRDTLVGSLVGLQALMVPPHPVKDVEPGKSQDGSATTGASSSAKRSKSPASRKN